MEPTLAPIGCVESITIISGDRIDSVHFVYRCNGTVDYVEALDSNPCTHEHCEATYNEEDIFYGGTGGTSTSSLSIGTNDYITEVEVCFEQAMGCSYEFSLHSGETLSKSGDSCSCTSTYTLTAAAGMQIVAFDNVDFGGAQAVIETAF